MRSAPSSQVIGAWPGTTWGEVVIHHDPCDWKIEESTQRKSSTDVYQAIVFAMSAV